MTLRLRCRYGKSAPINIDISLLLSTSIGRSWRCSHSFFMVFLLILNLGKSRFSTNHAFEICIFDGCNGEEMWKFTSLILFWSTSRQHLTRLIFAIYLQVLKAHWQVSKKWYFEEYILFIWSSMPIFSFIGYTMTELFRKPDNWQQIHKQRSFTFYASNDVSRR